MKCTNIRGENIVTINRAWNRSASLRLTQWLKIIPHIFIHCVYLKLGHRFHALLKVCSGRTVSSPLNSFILEKTEIHCYIDFGFGFGFSPKNVSSVVMTLSRDSFMIYFLFKWTYVTKYRCYTFPLIKRLPLPGPQRAGMWGGGGGEGKPRASLETVHLRFVLVHLPTKNVCHWGQSANWLPHTPPPPQ